MLLFLHTKNPWQNYPLYGTITVQSGLDFSLLDYFINVIVLTNEFLNPDASGFVLDSEKEVSLDKKYVCY